MLRSGLTAQNSFSRLRPIERLRPAPASKRSNNSSISSSLITSGGQSAMRSVGSGAHDQALFLGEAASRVWRHLPSAGSKCALVFLSATSSMPGDQAHALGLAHQRMIVQRASRLQEQRRDMAHMADNVAALIDLDGLERHRRGDRMAAIGEAMAQHADALAIRAR